MIKLLYPPIIMLLLFLTYTLYSQDLKAKNIEDSKQKILIYSKDTCSFCVKAKKLLEQKDLAYIDIDVTSDREQLVKLYNKTGQSTVPYIFIDEKFIGGYQELLELENSKSLDELFK